MSLVPPLHCGAGTPWPALADAPPRVPQGLRTGRLVVRVAPALPVETMLAGKPVEEAAEALPRLFSLCRTAQRMAVRRALGLPDEPDAQHALRREVLREHMAKLCLHWPARLCLPARSLPAGWQRGTGVARALFGPSETAPETPDEVEAYLESDTGAAPVLRGIDRCFAPGVATAPVLPPPGSETAFAASACENSVAGRQTHRPGMLHIEGTRGRGPLWRAMARLWDVGDALEGRMPGPVSHAPGTATVTAARGTYAIAAETRDGRVNALKRVTPTDHLLARGGILAHMLATLPPDREALAPLLLDIVDPCLPVRLEGGRGDA